MRRKERIAIVGAGAVGGYYGARLAQHGHDVHFLLRGDYEAVRSRGFVVRSCDGDFTVPADRLHAYDDPAKMPPADWVIVTLKSTANDELARLIAPLLHETTAILTLQNGLGNEETLAELFGEQRILGGMAFVCINRSGAGVIDHTDHGVIRLGEFGRPGRSVRSEWIADALNRSNVQCEILDNLLLGRWQKLVWNIPFNGLSTAMDLTTDQLLATSAGESLVREIMAEVVATAAALCVELEADIIEKNLVHTRSMGAYRTSMHVDRGLGRPLEIEAILGRPLAAARAAGVATPKLELLISLVKMVNLQRP